MHLVKQEWKAGGCCGGRMVAEARSIMNMGNGTHKVVREGQENLELGGGMTHSNRKAFC